MAININHKLNILKLIKEFISHLNSIDRLKFIAIVISSIISSIVEVIAVAVIPIFIYTIQMPDVVMASSYFNAVKSIVPLESKTHLFVAMGAAVFFVYLFRFTFVICATVAQSRFLERIQLLYASKLMSNLINREYSFHRSHNPNDLGRLIAGDMGVLFGSFILPFVILQSEIFASSMIVFMLLAVNAKVTIVTAIFFGATSCLMFLFIKIKALNYGNKNMLYSRAAYRWLNQAFSGIKEIKIYGQESYFIKKYLDNIGESYRASNNNGLISVFPRHVNEMLVVLVLVVMATAVVMEGGGQEFMPAMSLFAISAARLIPSFTRIVASMTNIRFGLSSTESVLNELRSEANELRSRDGGTGFTIERFENLDVFGVKYTHPNSKSGIRVDSLSVKRGEKVAFVGASGAGKTTLVDLVAGLLIPLEGSVKVNGRSIQLGLKNWQRMIGYIPQDVYLIDDSIQANILFGIESKSIDQNKLEDVMRMAQLEDLISMRGSDCDSTGASGSMLSGGQKQRIGIARALYRDAEVLVMDESTSSLDNVTEAKIIQSLTDLGRDKTIIIVTHRLSSVKQCDRIYIVKDGYLAASGRYEYLESFSEDFRLLIASD